VKTVLQLSPTGKFPLGLFFGAGEKQKSSSEYREAADDGREWYVLLSVRGGMYRAHIEKCFAMRVIDALIGERQGTQNHQQNAGERDWFHDIGSAPRSVNDASALQDPNQQDHDGQDQQ
jgi:hypothetical protein